MINLEEHLRTALSDKLFFILQTFYPPTVLSSNRFLTDKNLSVFYGHYSELHSLAQPVLTFIFKTRSYVAHVVVNQSHYLSIRSVRFKLHCSRFLSQTADLWNRLPSERFPDHYNSLFMSRVKRHLLHIPVQTLPL